MLVAVSTPRHRTNIGLTRDFVKVTILMQDMESRSSNAKIGFIGLVKQDKVNRIKKTVPG